MPLAIVRKAQSIDPAISPPNAHGQKPRIGRRIVHHRLRRPWRVPVQSGYGCLAGGPGATPRRSRRGGARHGRASRSASRRSRDHQGRNPRDIDFSDHNPQTHQGLMFGVHHRKIVMATYVVNRPRKVFRFGRLQSEFRSGDKRRQHFVNGNQSVFETGYIQRRRRFPSISGG